jgi:hypothetical protein
MGIGKTQELKRVNFFSTNQRNGIYRQSNKTQTFKILLSDIKEIVSKVGRK